MSIKRFGVWGSQMASTAHIKINKREDGKYEASVLGSEFKAVAGDENRAARELKEMIEREARSGK